MTGIRAPAGRCAASFSRPSITNSAGSADVSRPGVSFCNESDGSNVFPARSLLTASG